MTQPQATQFPSSRPDTAGVPLLGIEDPMGFELFAAQLKEFIGRVNAEREWRQMTPEGKKQRKASLKRLAEELAYFVWCSYRVG